MSPTFSYGQFSESAFEMRVTCLHQRILEGDVSARPRVAPASRGRTILILTIAIVCLAPLSSCVTTFAPPPVTAELMQARTNAEVATLRQGRTLFVHRCIECHTLPPFWHYRAEDWPHIIDTMSHRANLRPADRDAIVAYILAVRAQ